MTNLEITILSDLVNNPIKWIDLREIIQKETFSPFGQKIINHIEKNNFDVIYSILKDDCKQDPEWLKLGNADPKATFQLAKRLQDEATARKIKGIGFEMIEADTLSEALTIGAKLENIHQPTESLSTKLGRFRKNFAMSKPATARWNCGGIDDYLGGLDPKAQYVIGAYPGTGKTTLGLDILISLCEQGQTVLFNSIEMDEDQILLKLVAQITNQHYKTVQKKWRSGHLDNKIDTAIQKIESWDLHLSFEPYLENIVTKAKVLNQKHDLNFLFIDYFQLIKTRQKMPVGMTHIKNEHISTELMLLKNSIDCTNILLSQLSRGGVGQNALRGGGIEQAATDIFLLDRDETGASLDIVKCRTAGDLVGKIINLDFANHSYREKFEEVPF